MTASQSSSGREAEVQRAVVEDVLEEAGRLVKAAAEEEGEHRVVLDTTQCVFCRSTVCETDSY